MSYQELWLAYVDHWHTSVATLPKSDRAGLCQCPEDQVGGTCPTSTRYADRQFRENLFAGPGFSPPRNKNH